MSRRKRETSQSLSATLSERLPQKQAYLAKNKFSVYRKYHKISTHFVLGIPDVTTENVAASEYNFR